MALKDPTYTAKGKKRSQKLMFLDSDLNALMNFSFSAAAIALGGLGGRAGMKGAGKQTILDMTAVYSTMCGTPPRLGAHMGPIRDPNAAPKGLAREATAVAETRPVSENQRLEYLVGAAKTKGCAKPTRICPNMRTPNRGGLQAVPAYRIQLPSSASTLATTIETFGPPRLRVQITTGAAGTKAKRQTVDSQLMVGISVLKKRAAVEEMGAKVIQSQLMMMFRSTSWARPMNRRL